MQSGRQTDATVINIFWPWDQLLRLAGGDDKPHRMAQSGLSNVTKPEKDLSYRSTNWQRKNSSSYLLSAWGTTLLPAPLSARFRWCSHFSHGGLQWKSKKTRPGIHNTLCYEERGSFWRADKITEIQLRVYFHWKTFVFIWTGANFNTIAVHVTAWR